MSDRESQSDFFSDDETDEEHQVFLRSKGKNLSNFRTTTEEEEEEEEEDEGSDSDQEEKESNRSSTNHTDKGSNEEYEDDDEDLPLDHNDDSLSSKSTTISKKLKKLTPKELEKEQKRIKKTGVCYLSKIPPYMKPAKLRSVLSRFGSIDRIFLKPEEASIYHKRVKYGGNKKKRFTEGWIEFVNKKDAKLCAQTLNGNKLGGKKTSYYYDDIINIKYLSGFKWMDLTQQIAKENEVRQAKLALDLSQQNKFNKAFVHNVEQLKMIEGIKRKRSHKDKEVEQDGDNKSITSKSSKDDSDKLRRHFKQRKVTSTRSDASTELKEKSTPNDRLTSVLSKVL